MTDEVRAALENDRLIDITTTGRQSGNPTRKEIWFHNVDGDLFITGTPGKRDWYANVIANPRFTFHLKESTDADINATARPVTQPDEKRAVLEKILARLDRSDQIDRWVQESPLIEVDLAVD